MKKEDVKLGELYRASVNVSKTPMDFNEEAIVRVFAIQKEEYEIFPVRCVVVKYLTETFMGIDKECDEGASLHYEELHPIFDPIDILKEML